MFYILVFSSVNLTGQGSFYISDAGNFTNGPYQILKCNEDGSDLKVFIDKDLSWPQDILFLEERNEVLISNLSSNSIDIFNASTGDYISRFASDIQGPTRMKIGKDSLLYVLQWTGVGKVKRYDLNGNFIDDFTKVGVPTSIGMDWDQNGNLYVSSFNGKYIERFNPQGQSMGKFISTGLAGPTNIQFLTNGQLIVLDYSSGNVKLYDADGKFLKNLVSGVVNCEGIHVNADGSFVIGVGQAKSVRWYDAEGKFIKNLFSPGGLQLKNPNAVVFRRDVTSSDDPAPFTEIDFLKKVSEFQFELMESDFSGQINQVQLFDQNGKQIFTQNMQGKKILDLSSLSAGIYFANAKTEGQKYRQKIWIRY